MRRAMSSKMYCFIKKNLGVCVVSVADINLLINDNLSALTATTTVWMGRQNLFWILRVAYICT